MKILSRPAVAIVFAWVVFLSNCGSTGGGTDAGSGGGEASGGGNAPAGGGGAGGGMALGGGQGGGMPENDGGAGGGSGGGGAMVNDAGTGGGGGGMDAGVDCNGIAERYTEKLAQSKACDPTTDAGTQCLLRVTPTLACACPTFINDSAVFGQLAQMEAEFQAGGCKKGPACGAPCVQLGDRGVCDGATKTCKP
jgi:hypothetical protein